MEIVTARLNKNKTLSERWADLMTNGFGTLFFFNLNLLVFVAWIIVNLGWIPGVAAFDPFPFGLLTMAVSLEAIFLSIIVLMSQNRAAKIADMREEIDLQINLRSEQEITAILRILDGLERRLNVAPTNKAEAKSMRKDLDIHDIEKRVRETING